MFIFEARKERAMDHIMSDSLILLAILKNHRWIVLQHIDKFRTKVRLVKRLTVDT